jgi:hypothetical protein
MTGIPIHRVVECREVMVGDHVLVDDEHGWRKVNDVILSPSHAVLKYEGGADMVDLTDFVSVLRAQALTSMEVC